MRKSFNYSFPWQKTDMSKPPSMSDDIITEYDNRKHCIRTRSFHFMLWFSGLAIRVHVWGMSSHLKYHQNQLVSVNKSEIFFIPEGHVTCLIIRQNGPLMHGVKHRGTTPGLHATYATTAKSSHFGSHDGLIV